MGLEIGLTLWSHPHGRLRADRTKFVAKDDSFSAITDEIDFMISVKISTS